MNIQQRKAALHSPDFRGWPVGWSIARRYRFPKGYKIILSVDREGRITSIRHGKHHIKKESIPNMTIADAVGMLDQLVYRMEDNPFMDEPLRQRFKRFRQDQMKLFRAVFMGRL